jgi:hydroxymethylglutaryl-CoA reductase
MIAAGRRHNNLATSGNTDNVRKFTEIVAATVLCGELSR